MRPSIEDHVLLFLMHQRAMKRIRFVLGVFLIAVIFFGLKYFHFLAMEKSSNAVELKTDKFRKARQECSDNVETSMQKDYEGLSNDFLYQDCMLRKGYFLID